MTRPRYKAANHKDGRRRHRLLLLLRLKLGKNNRWTDRRTDGQMPEKSGPGNQGLPSTALNNTDSMNHA